MNDSVFTKIIKRELPAEVIYEDELVIVILNRFPNIPGETLVITKEQASYAFALSDETYTHVMKIAKKMAIALDAAFATKRTCLVIEGFDVPHVHVRLYPITDGTLVLKHGPEASTEELRAVGEKIRAQLA